MRQVLVEDGKAVGVRLKKEGGKIIRAKRAVVMNADRWAASKLLPKGTIPEEKRWVLDMFYHSSRTVRLYLLHRLNAHFFIHASIDRCIR